MFKKPESSFKLGNLTRGIVSNLVPQGSESEMDTDDYGLPKLPSLSSMLKPKKDMQGNTAPVSNPLLEGFVGTSDLLKEYMNKREAEEKAKDNNLATINAINNVDNINANISQKPQKFNKLPNYIKRNEA